MKRLFAALLASAAILTAAPLAAAPDVVTGSVPNVLPESFAAGPDGALYLGSLSTPVIYRARPGEATATPFIDLSDDKAAESLGVMVDGATSTLWVCEIVSFERGSPLLSGHSVLRSFDLASGKPKARYPLPGTTNVCNDAVVGPDKALYVSDTSNAQILRLKPGDTTFETVIQNSAIYGVDGIAFLGGTLYVNTVWSNAMFRIPMDASGKVTAPPVQILVPQLLHSPDGLRVANGKMYMAENSGGQVDLVTINNDRATITALKTGLMAPTAVEPHGDTLWIGDRAASKIIAIPLPK